LTDIAVFADPLDISAGKVGKLCSETNTFIVDGIGELEFEVEENELTLTVDSLVGEWAIFIPQAAAGGAAGGAAGNATGGAAGGATGEAAGGAAGGASDPAAALCGQSTACRNALSQLLQLIGA
jgi:hypothetical protein